MPHGEEIDINGNFDFARLNLKVQKSVRNRTMAMVHAVGDHDERKTMLLKRLLKAMCVETGKPGKQSQLRLDACKLSVHCLYDIALSDASEGKMVIQTAITY